MKKIVHLTSSHFRYYIRIFRKECKTLAKNDFDVTLIVADRNGDEIIDDIKIFDVGKKNGRLKRILLSSKLIYKKVKQINADVYHFHDSELLPYAYLIKKSGKKVIYDSHEDLPKQILSKPYLKKYQKIIISSMLQFFENFIAKQFDFIITSTPYIRDKFLKINKNTCNVNNFPILNELLIKDNHFEKKMKYVMWEELVGLEGL